MFTKTNDATVTHSWVFDGAARHHGSLGPGSVRHAEYLLQLAAAWNSDPLRPNWLQEVGAPTDVVPVADTPEFLERTVRCAADVQHLLGITWGCSHDVPRSLTDFPELEYDLGLLDESNRRKATGERFAALMADLRDRPAPAPPTVGLVVDDVDAAGARVEGSGCAARPVGRFRGPGRRSPNGTDVDRNFCCALVRTPPNSPLGASPGW